jgi:hypothetical protein
MRIEEGEEEDNQFQSNPFHMVMDRVVNWKRDRGRGRERGRRTHRVGSQVISHIGPIIIPNQNRHIIFNSNIIRKDIHISVVPVYLSAYKELQELEAYQHAQHHDTISLTPAHPPNESRKDHRLLLYYLGRGSNHGPNLISFHFQFRRIEVLPFRRLIGVLR